MIEFQGKTRQADCTFRLDLTTNTFECKLCGEKFPSLTDALSHAQEKHPKTGEPKQ